MRRHEQRLDEAGSSPISSRRPRGSSPADGSSKTSTLRVHRQHGRQRHALALAEREVMGEPALEAGHPHGRERPLDALVDLASGDAHVERSERDVVEAPSG